VDKPDNPADFTRPSTATQQTMIHNYSETITECPSVVPGCTAGRGELTEERATGRGVVSLTKWHCCQYTSKEFHQFCRDNGVLTSVGRTGVCWDNAAAESFFATLKNEMYYRQRFATRARARFAVAEYIEIFYNRQRLHSHLGYRTPAEALTDHQARAVA
jgi:transposase InsO family protein